MKKQNKKIPKLPLRCSPIVLIELPFLYPYLQKIIKIVENFR